MENGKITLAVKKQSNVLTNISESNERPRGKANKKKESNT